MMADRDSAEPTDGDVEGEPATDRESLRTAVEARFDFEDFGPSDMAEMSLEEWEAVFDPDTWITGPELLDRVEAELRTRVAAGELFAVVERHTADGEPRLLAYTDSEYAVLHPDGTVEGDSGIRREIEPIVALCSMETYDVSDPPEGTGLPDPSSVTPGTGNLGHRLLLAVAAVQVVAGVVLLLAPVVVSPGAGSGALTIVVGLGFLLVGIVIGILVANARLSGRFRAAEYRNRLRAAGVGTDERPSFLPQMDGDGSSDGAADDGS